MTQTTQAVILDGKKIAQKHLDAVYRRIQSIKEKGQTLTLATVRVGDFKDAQYYSKAIDRLMNQMGIECVQRVFPSSISEPELMREISLLNKNETLAGILVFSPLPAHIHPSSTLNVVDIFKDVEGRRILDTTGERVISPTASACLALIEETGHEVKGAEAVVIGCSEIVGKPCAILLMDRRATVTICHSKTKDLRGHVEKADIVVATAGKAELVKGDWIKRGAVVVDVGENVVDGKLVGDVDFEAARARASYITPVPGGVGPLTNVMLIKNLIKLHELKTK